MTIVDLNYHARRSEQLLRQFDLANVQDHHHHGEDAVWAERRRVRLALLTWARQQYQRAGRAQTGFWVDELAPSPSLPANTPAP
jgi:hypothetical protein